MGEILDRDSPVPLFLQIRQKLLGEIRYWADPAEQFPTDIALADRFSVSKMTVRNAIDDLVTAGLLTRQRGKGTFVTEAAYVERLSPSLDIAEHYTNQHGPQDVSVLGFSERSATKEEAKVFGRVPVVTVQRLRLLRGVPLALDERTIPADVCADAGLNEKTAKGNIAALLRNVVPLDRARWQFRALAADNDIALHLCVGVGEPVLERAMTYVTTDNRTVLMGRTIHRGDLISSEVELPLAPDVED